jgi:Mn-dependent DtxR family transcriptional regulator
MQETPISPAVENYLKAIYLLETKTGRPVPTTKLA